MHQSLESILFLTLVILFRPIPVSSLTHTSLVSAIVAAEFPNCATVLITRRFTDMPSIGELSELYVPTYIMTSAAPQSMNITEHCRFSNFCACKFVAIERSAKRYMPEQQQLIAKFVPIRLFHSTPVLMLSWRDATFDKGMFDKFWNGLPLILVAQPAISHSGRPRTLVVRKLYGYEMEFRNISEKSGSVHIPEPEEIVGDLLVGGFDPVNGYRRCNPIFPHRDEFAFKIAIRNVFPLDFYNRHNFTNRMFVFNEISHMWRLFLAKFQVYRNPTGGIYLEGDPVGQKYHKEMSVALKKTLFAIGLVYFLDEPNTFKIQPSSPYTYYTDTIIYRKLQSSGEGKLRDNFLHPIETYFLPIAGVATLMLFLSRRWDLVTRARLPKPMNREKWKRRCRKLRFSTIYNILWEIASNMAQQKRFPEPSLSHFTPSATMTLVFVTFFAIVVNFFMRLAPLADMVQPVPTLVLKTTDDVLHLAKFNAKISFRSVKIISVVDRETSAEILSTRRYPQVLEDLLTEAQFQIHPQECLKKAKEDNPKYFFICIGILNVLARAMMLDKGASSGDIKVREVGSMKYCSYALSPGFPLTDAISKMVSRAVEAGLPEYWVEQVRSKTATRANDTSADVTQKDIISHQILDTSLRTLSTEITQVVGIFCLELIIGYRSLIWIYFKKYLLPILSKLWEHFMQFSQKINEQVSQQD